MEQTRENLEVQILERAAQDPQFREQLKRDPRGTVARDLGVEVPQDMTVEVVEETPSTVYLVLPAETMQSGQQLTSQELEAVAGGWTTNTYGCASCGQDSCGCGTWESCGPS